MSTPKMMTQASLTELLLGRGWQVNNRRDEHNANMMKITHGKPDVPGLDMRKGISMHAISPTGYLLSLQASFGNYCDPRGFAEEYESLEFAIWKVPSNGTRKDGPFVQDRRLHDHDDVVGWADFDKVMLAIEIIESWKDGVGPLVYAPTREEHDWDVGD
jgi:hypothetical protein